MRYFLTFPSKLVKSVSLYAESAGILVFFACGTVGRTFLANTIDVSVLFGTSIDASVAEEIAFTADTDVIYRVGASRTHINAGGSKEIETGSTGLTEIRLSGAGKTWV